MCPALGCSPTRLLARRNPPTEGSSLDHLIGARRQPGRHVKAERLGGFQVDHELEPGGLIDRQVGGLFALENPSDVKSGTTISIQSVVAIAHQAALFDKFPVGVHVGDSVSRGQRDNLLAPAGKEWIPTNKKRAGAPLSQGNEGGIDLAWAAGVEHK